MSALYTVLQSLTNLFLVPACIILVGMVNMSFQGDFNKLKWNHQDDNDTVYVVSPKVPDTLTDKRTKQQYWISCILKAANEKTSISQNTPSVNSDLSPANFWQKEVKRVAEKENHQTLEEMRIDKYYWLHYLDKENPEVM